MTPESKELPGISKQGLRFLIFGALNTLATYALYCVLVAFIAPQVAYAIVFALGIGLAYLLNSRFVFGSRMRASTATAYPLIYLGQYAVNAMLIEVLVRAGLGPRAALAAALALVTPLSFLLNYLLLGRRTATAQR
jgi:putative flippase GtrA